MQLDMEAQDGWHTDGNAQFVVVVMLSDPTHVLGGETEVRCGDGSIRKITYPAPGYAIMLQVYPSPPLSPSPFAFQNAKNLERNWTPRGGVGPSRSTKGPGPRLGITIPEVLNM